ncbi:hypothetical protein CH375_06735 [Leptospira ellisii]|uniref:Uncharacterized protein n=1 Tax=Leptospira ellisii TaxID=2023197 RepID=A0A2N0BMQ9_9LEPT|nr:hypothetical protein CH379_03435 [Leptospira ellisii]PKA05168.1 hypothetical protein CH375_06735 [Leptospira ellisii]
MWELPSLFVSRKNLASPKFPEKSRNSPFTNPPFLYRGVLKSRNSQNSPVAERNLIFNDKRSYDVFQNENSNFP